MGGFARDCARYVDQDDSARVCRHPLRAQVEPTWWKAAPRTHIDECIQASRIALVAANDLLVVTSNLANDCVRWTMTGWRALMLGVLATPAGAAYADELAGSSASMRRQNEVAREAELVFARTATEVRAEVDSGTLVRVESSRDLRLHEVSQPYARAEVKLFVERLAAQYRAATGAPLVVTSLTRPTGSQPSNASPLSVHPAGMAADLRVPSAAAERAWLEETLLSLERAGVLDVTRERRPPHYHVAIFPTAYRAHVARVDAGQALAAARADSVAKAPRPAPMVQVVAEAPVSRQSSTATPLLSTLGAFGLAVGGLLWQRRNRRRA
jgi:hypothetical protein